MDIMFPRNPTSNCVHLHLFLDRWQHWSSTVDYGYHELCSHLCLEMEDGYEMEISFAEVKYGEGKNY